MNEKDNIKDLFSKKLTNYEAKVDPQLWTNISSQIGSAVTSTAAGTGVSLLTKVIIGTVVTAAVVTTGVILFNNNQEDNYQEEIVLVDNQTGSNNEESPSEEPIKQDNSLPENESVINESEQEKTSTTSINSEEDERNTQTETQTATTGSETGSGIIPLDNERVTKEDNPLDTVPDINETSTPETENTKSNESEATEEDQGATEIKEEAEEFELRLPDFFTPNNDGENDMLNIQKDNELEGLSKFQVVVLNNRNQIVYQSQDPHFQWNGEGPDSMPVEAGTYIYFITAVDKNGNPVTGHQTLRIIR